VPGLYESLFYGMFKCNSPKIVCDLLKKYVGNGPVQDDIVASAADALERDRPGLYDAYHVADLTAMALT